MSHGSPCGRETRRPALIRSPSPVPIPGYGTHGIGTATEAGMRALILDCTSAITPDPDVEIATKTMIECFQRHDV
jgi:hypothetical protein